MDKNELPKGWGEDYEDDDLEFSPFDIEDDEDSPWGTSSNSESKNSIVSENQDDECRTHNNDAATPNILSNSIQGGDITSSSTQIKIDSVDENITASAQASSYVHDQQYPDDEQLLYIEAEFDIDDENVSPYLLQAREAIKEGKWDFAKECCQSSIQIDSQKPQPYLYLMLCSEKIDSIYKLGYLAVKKGLVSFTNYSIALSYSNENQKNILNDLNMKSIYNCYKSEKQDVANDHERFLTAALLYRNIYLFMNSQTLSENSRQKGLEYLYNLSNLALASAETFGDFERVFNMFSQISEYENSSEIAQQCYEKYEQVIYHLIDSDEATIDELEAALKDLPRAYNLKNSKWLMRRCQEKINQLRNKEEKLYYDQLYENSKKRKRITVCIVSIIVTIISVIFLIIEVSAIIKDSNSKNQSNGDLKTDNIEDSIPGEVDNSKINVEKQTEAETSVTEEYSEKIENPTFDNSYSSLAEIVPIKNKEISDNAYGSFLGQKYNELQGSEEYTMSDITTNEFAICDIDNDGYEELLLSLTSGCMASYVLNIYNCDDYGEVSLKATVFPGSTFYENGTIEIPISHNQGLAGNFWPYSVKKYEPSTDDYIDIGDVDAWDKSSFPKDFDGNTFPDSYDTSHSGILYYITADGYSGRDIPLDKKVYDQWRNSWVGNGKQIDLNYQKLTTDNIKKLYPTFEPTTPAPKETYAFYGVVSTESDSLNLRDKPSIDSNVITQLSKGTKGSIYYIEGYPDWYKIYTDSGYEGYVSAQYIKEYKENDYYQNYGNNNNSNVQADAVNIVLNKSTPMEFSEYNKETLISTVRVDQVKYELELASKVKYSDTDYDEYYITLNFYLTKTYDRYSAEQRYSSNPGIYFLLTDLTEGRSYYSSFYNGKYVTSSIGDSDLKREGDTIVYTWKSKDFRIGNLGTTLDSTHEYMVSIMDHEEAFGY